MSAAGALDRDGASGDRGRGVGRGDETVDYLDSENAPWWDPEALAALLCATRVADGARDALRASDQAVMARRLAGERGWSRETWATWCGIRTAQHGHERVADAALSRSTS